MYLRPERRSKGGAGKEISKKQWESGENGGKENEFIISKNKN